MRKLTFVLCAILAAIVCIGVEYHNDQKRQQLEADKKTLSECWQNAAANGVGADLCKVLAETMNK